MKPRTLELIGSLILGAVAIGMASQSRAATVTRADLCIAQAEFAVMADKAFDRGTSLTDVVMMVSEKAEHPVLRKQLMAIAVTVYEYHETLTPAEFYAGTFDACMKVNRK